jgi:two-component system response regulator (stage 0 sporulation protein F)
MIRPGAARIWHVLIADDDDDLRDALRACIDQDGLFRVSEASDGNQALVRILADQPDVVLLDHRMPGLTGVEVAQRLQVCGATTRIVFATAASKVGELARAAGARWFLAKPFGCEELMSLLRRLVAEEGVAVDVDGVRRARGP